MNDYIGNVYEKEKENEVVLPRICIINTCGGDSSSSCTGNFCNMNSDNGCFFLSCSYNM